MKVLFVINQLFKGGAETALVNLISAMPTEKYQVDLLIYDQIDLPDTVTLIPNIPSHVKVYNTAEREKKLAYIKKAIFKVCKKITGRTVFRKKAYRVFEENAYDIAISFGEWFSCSLVANRAKARWKYVWIHADADKADFFHPDIHLYHECFDGFIFVSKNSKLAAEKQYPFLKNRGYIINNIINQDEVVEKSAESPSVSLPDGNLPRLVTVANVRPEKNHVRQIRVMKKLFDEGLRFYWINVGAQANPKLNEKIDAEIRKAGLEDYFLFTGATENPYSVIKRCDAVCVLSDHESWSMVITEAKAIGTPVIATKTSGALEQIIHKENGILCDFDEEDIADKIREFLTDSAIAERIRKNLRGFSSATDTLGALDALFTNQKKLIYVFDDINYMSGARAATLMQADYLRNLMRVDLFSVCALKDEALYSKYRVIDIENNESFKCLSVPTREVLASKEYSKRAKLKRITFAIRVKLGIDIPFYEKLLKKELCRIFDGYDYIIVVSEASRLRHFVATLQNPKKIQWIHTDYTAWRDHSNWTRKFTSNDGKTYEKYDAIVCLSDKLRDKLTSHYPHLSDKIITVPNLIDYENIIKKANADFEIKTDKSKLNLITIGRMEEEKRFDRILLLAKELKESGVNFSWYLVGDGKLLESYKSMCRDMNLTENVIFAGYLDNACPLLKQCDIFILLSEYEGTPVTIDEAKVLGVPVLAIDVGGIADQLEDGKYGKTLSHITADDIISFANDSKNITQFFSSNEFNEYTNLIHNKISKLLEVAEK